MDPLDPKALIYGMAAGMNATEDRWRRILVAYMRFLNEVEGSHFLNGRFGEPNLSDEDLAELYRARDEADERP